MLARIADPKRGSGKLVFEDLKIGETFGPDEYIVNHEIVEMYCNEFGDRNPIYLQDSPFGGAVVPPTIDATWLNLRLINLKYDAHATIPAKIELEFINPAKVGKRLIVWGKIIDKYVKRGLEYVVFETMMVDEDGNKIRRSVDHFLLGLK